MRKGKKQRSTDPLFAVEYDMQLDLCDHARVGRICQTLRCTIYELCAMSGLFNRSRIKQIQEKRKFWPTELALHFYRLESYYLERKLGNPTLPDPGQREAARILHRAQQIDEAVS